MVPHLTDRPLSVIRVRPGQPPFMQKNLPKYTPDWVQSTPVWADRPKREVTYALANDRRTLLWFANQRAVEYHPALMRAPHWEHQTHLILDLDPPSGVDREEGFSARRGAAQLVHQVLDEAGMAGAAKTSGAKGVHVFVPLAPADTADVAAATRAIAARAERIDSVLATTAFIVEERHGKVFLDSTRAAARRSSPPTARGSDPACRSRSRSPGTSWTPWPADFTLRTAPDLAAGGDPWAERMPEPQTLPAELVAEGHEIPIARVLAMHEGKRRAKAKRDADQT